MKLLIVEDNVNNLYLIRYILEKNNYEVDAAMDGHETLDYLAKNKVDAILMDIQLPDINGLDLTRQIKKDESLKNIPIIAITSYAMTGDREKAMAAGCNGYIEKPINPETIVRDIEQYLKV